MKILADRRTLSDVLQLAATVVPPSRIHIPIPSSVLVRAGAQGVEVVATDLDVTVRLRVPEVAVEREGTVALPAHRLAAVVRESADEKATLEADGQLATLEMKDGRFKLVGTDPADFPELPELDERRAIEIEAADLADMVRKTEFAAAQEAVTYAMSGILLELKGRELRMVATDGKRLALVRRKSGGEKGVKKEINALVPPKAMKLLQRLAPEGEEMIQMNVEENQIRLRSSRGLLASRLLEGRFPDYEQVIPKESARKATLSTREFAAALRRAALLAPEGARAVKLTFQRGRLELFTRCPDIGEARVEIPAEYAGETFAIVFNPDFILEYLKVVETESVEIGMNEPTSACVFRGGKDYLYIAMALQMSL